MLAHDENYTMALIIEPPHEKTNILHRRKQSRRSAVQLAHLFSPHG